MPSLKFFLNGSLAIVTGWEPTDGKFYSSDWYAGGKKPVDRSIGYQLGMLISKKIFSSSYYVATGIDMASYSLNNFRTTPAYDPRHISPNTIVYDTSYSDYTINNLQVPVYFQIPLSTRKIYFALRAGTVNDFTYSEAYTTVFSEKNGSQYNENHLTKRQSGIRYHSTKLHLGCDFEVKNEASRIIMMLSSGITTAPVASVRSNAYFLHYATVFFMSFGFGYCIDGNKNGGSRSGSTQKPD